MSLVHSSESLVSGEKVSSVSSVGLVLCIDLICLVDRSLLHSSESHVSVEKVFFCLLSRSLLSVGLFSFDKWVCVLFSFVW